MACGRPKMRARVIEPVQADFYEAEEGEPDEEKFSGQRYDVCARLYISHSALVFEVASSHRIQHACHRVAARLLVL